ncbi:MAG: MFS transporter [Thermoplasmata archaeon]|nr:MFS transporter [Thermoplasmata archaeon]
MAELNRGYFALFRNRRFALGLSSSGLAWGGYAVYEISILLLSYQISHSLAIAGVVLLVEFGAYSITFIAGPTVDRARNLRTVLLFGYGLQALFAFIIGLTLQSGHLSVPVLLVLVAGISLVWDFTWTADNALIPRLVSEGELFRANALFNTVSGGNTVVGFGVGGALLLFVGPGGGMFVYAALNLASAAIVIPLSLPSVRTATTGLLQDFWDGWRELGRGKGHPLLQLAVFSSAQGFFTGAGPLLITLLTQQQFVNPTFSYALLFTAFTVGGVAGGLILGYVNPRTRISWVMFGSTAAEGLLILAAVHAAPLIVPSLILWFFTGVMAAGFYQAYLTYLQARVPTDRFGRVLTNLYLFRGIPTALGALTVGALAALWGAPMLGWVIALTYLLCAVVGPALLPGVRRLTF